jgi:uncharacterized SAM-binding protein YcdF (DUF218 family)
VPPSPIRRRGLSRRILVVVILAAVVASGMYAVDRLGPFLAVEDPLVNADAVLVLAGTRMTRPLEGAELVREGYAPVMVLTRETVDPGLEIVARRGHPFPQDADRAREVFVTMGVRREAILIPDRIHTSTASEAETLRELALAHGWRRVIVVTSKFHLRRAAYAMRRELRGTGVEVRMRATRYDPLQPERWWARRAESRWVAAEFPKLIAYVLGLGA